MEKLKTEGQLWRWGIVGKQSLGLDNAHLPIFLAPKERKVTQALKGQCGVTANLANCHTVVIHA